jgi:hypothetical protein
MNEIENYRDEEHDTGKSICSLSGETGAARPAAARPDGQAAPVPRDRARFSETGECPLSGETDPAIAIDGQRYWRDAGGRLVPEGLVKPADRLIDQTVRAIVSYADDLSARIARFRGHTFDDIGALQDLLAANYGARAGGRKGNVTLTSFDGTIKVSVQVQDHISYGPELQVAKSLVDECIAGWAAGARDEIRVLVEHAFQVDKEGRINRGALYQLRRVDIDDERWHAAMQAIADSMRVIGSSTYVRFYRRDDPRGRWQPVTVDLAQAGR